MTDHSLHVPGPAVTAQPSPAGQAAVTDKISSCCVACVCVWSAVGSGLLPPSLIHSRQFCMSCSYNSAWLMPWNIWHLRIVKVSHVDDGSWLAGGPDLTAASRSYGEMNSLTSILVELKDSSGHSPTSKFLTQNQMKYFGNDTRYNKKLSWCWQTCVTRLEASQGHWRWYWFHSIDLVWFAIIVL